MKRGNNPRLLFILFSIEEKHFLHVRSLPIFSQITTDEQIHHDMFFNNVWCISYILCSAVYIFEWEYFLWQQISDIVYTSEDWRTPVNRENDKQAHLLTGIVSVSDDNAQIWLCMYLRQDNRSNRIFFKNPINMSQYQLKFRTILNCPKLS